MFRYPITEFICLGFSLILAGFTFYLAGHQNVTRNHQLFDNNIYKELLKIFKTEKYDFVSNSINRAFPIGADIRIFSLASLLKYSSFVKGKARQHTCYFFLNFKLLIIKNIKNYLGKTAFVQSK